MAQKESGRSARIMQALRQEGWFCWKTHGNEYTMSGLPDINVVADGLYVGLETKEPEKRDNVSAVQKLRHRQIKDAGGHAYVVCGVDEAVARVRQALREGPSSSGGSRPTPKSPLDLDALPSLDL